MDITGASAIVTGGASGIGAASARRLAERGAKVVIADLQEDRGGQLADELGGAFVKVDVTNTDDIVEAVELAKSVGPVRVLVNSAGIGWAQRTVGKDGSYESAANIDAFKRVIAINLIGTFDFTRIAGTAMSTTDVDSAGVNVLLAGFCQELGIRSVLTTEVINWARSSVKEFDLARRLVYPRGARKGAAEAAGTEPRDAPRSEALRAGRRGAGGTGRARDRPELPHLRRARRDSRPQRQLYFCGTDPFEVFEQLAAADPKLDASHAFYLGYEFAKAVTALTLGKNYTQDQALRWGFLTVPE